MDFLDVASNVATILSAIIAGALIVFVHLRYSIEHKDVKAQKANLQERIKIREGKLTANTSLVDFIQAELMVVTERERLAMILAQSRSNRLYGIGIALMILSIFAPIASTGIYISMDPLETLARLKQHGIALTNLSSPPQRDWHILISGISFGFLFLAASRGILRQEEQQRATFFDVGRRIAHYENIVSALRISDKLQHEEKTSENNKLLEKVIDKLLEAPMKYSEYKGSDKESTSEKTTVDKLLEIMKTR